MLSAAPRMGDNQPLHEGAQLAIALRPQEKMPVVWHQRVRRNPHGLFAQRLAQNLLKCLVVRRLLKQLHSVHAAAQDMKNQYSRSNARGSCHR
jgi:hypothetical protein